MHFSTFSNSSPSFVASFAAQNKSVITGLGGGMVAATEKLLRVGSISFLANFEVGLATSVVVDPPLLMLGEAEKYVSNAVSVAYLAYRPILYSANTTFGLMLIPAAAELTRASMSRASLFTTNSTVCSCAVISRMRTVRIPASTTPPLRSV